jgi:hypothetical protein
MVNNGHNAAVIVVKIGIDCGKCSRTALLGPGTRRHAIGNSNPFAALNEGPNLASRDHRWGQGLHSLTVKMSGFFILRAFSWQEQVFLLFQIGLAACRLALVFF